MGQHENAYDEGFNAYHTGGRNPYKTGTTNAARFAMGYRHAKLQAQSETDYNERLNNGF